MLSTTNRKRKSRTEWSILLKSSLQLGTDQALVELSPVSARSRRSRSPRCGRCCCARCCRRDFSSTSFSSTVDVVRIAVTVVVEVVEHPPSAMLWLLLLRWCAHENLLSQSRWRSRLQGHLIVVVVAIGLGRLQLGCHVVVVVGLRSQSWFLTKQ